MSVGPMESQVQKKILEAFQPQHLLIENESPSHGLPASAEKHFRVELVSDQFSGKSRMERHQMVYALLKPELEVQIHALTMHLFTIEEWLQRGQSASESPQCLGGSRGR